jgi:2-hydroxychromene-2-carboxylate isomerase
LRRWKAYLNVPLILEPTNFPPTNLGLAARFAVSAPDNTAIGKLCGAILTALWAHDRNISDPETLKAIGNEAGMDGAKLLKSANGTAAQKAIDENSNEAIKRDVYGAPTYIYGEELLWGQDRLDFLDRALAAN